MSVNNVHYLLTIVFGLLYVSAVRSDTCNSETEGLMSCILFGFRYNDYQWAVCARAGEVRRNRGQRCYGSYCWLPCMTVTRGRHHGFISQECSCSSTKKLSRRNINTTCYIRTNGECSWYSDCLAKSAQCPGDTSASHVAQRMCNVFESHPDTLAADGKLYIRDLQQCLQRSLYSLILPGSSQNCSLRMQQAREANTYCLTKMPFTSKFCHLVPNDQSNIFWTIKPILVDAFGTTSRDMLDPLRNCYKGNVGSAEKRILVTASASEAANGQSFVDKFAQDLGWSLRNIVWDGYLMPQISSLISCFDIIFKPTYEFDLTGNGRQSSAIDMTSELNKIEAELQKNSLGVTAVYYTEGHLAYFKDIGQCPFHVGDGGIFDFVSPEPIEAMDIQFDLYRRQSSGIRKDTLNYFDDSSIKMSTFNGNQKTYFITHGFTNDGNEKWIKNMYSAFLDKEDCNVIVVDWRDGADMLSISDILYMFPIYIHNIALGLTATVAAAAKTYLQAAVNTRLAGCFVGKMVEKLINLRNTSYGNVHLVGHSLGAHVSGFAGLYMDGQVGRVTGLDPAGPGFTDLGRNFRLDETDAVFVDIIHTDTVLFGIDRPIGNVDFYPEGGYRQPGCFIVGCSHGRACELFIESINSTCEFLACRCSKSDYDYGRCRNGGTCTQNTMGFRVDKTSTGSFYLDTNSKSPFCTGSLPDRKRKKRMTEGNTMTKGQIREIVLFRKMEKLRIKEHDRERSKLQHIIPST